MKIKLKIKFQNKLNHRSKGKQKQKQQICKQNKNKGKFIRTFPHYPPYYSSHNVQAKKKAPKKILMKKKIFNGINKYNIITI
jgi:hypothetical protein